MTQKRKNKPKIKSYEINSKISLDTDLKESGANKILKNHQFCIYEFDDYKFIIKNKLKLLKSEFPGISLQKIAQNINIQYTFLSKILNSDSVHISEDHLYKFCKNLFFNEDEIEYLFLLRSKESSECPDRKNHLIKKIKNFQTIHQNTKLEIQNKKILQTEYDIKYLFDPYIMVVHAALSIHQFQKNPKNLCTLLQLSLNKIEEYLIILEKLEYIKIGKNNFEIIEVFDKFPHFSPDHPLTRIHQMSIKSFLLNRLSQTSESDKESFFVTFTMDPNGFQKTKSLFRKFISDVQKITFEGQRKNLYQLNFDLIKIL